MTCSKCGNELNEGAKFCTKCGSKVRVKLNKLFIPSVILMSVGLLGSWLPLGSPLFFSGITLALISLYKNKHKTTMSVGIAAGALNILFTGKFLQVQVLLWGILINIILSGAIILTFILLYKKRHKIILIVGLGVYVLTSQISSMIFGILGGVFGFFLSRIFPSLYIILFAAITIAFISLYKKKDKMTMIAGLAASVLNLLLMIPRIMLIVIMRSDIEGWVREDRIAETVEWISRLRIQNIRDIILSGAIILAFILLYKKKHKIILIAGLAVIALFLVLNLVSLFRNLSVLGW